MSALKALILMSFAWLLSACIAPITPPPGPQIPGLPMPPSSSSGLPSPSSMPPSTPNAPPSAPSSSPPGSSSPSSSPPSSSSPPGSTQGEQSGESGQESTPPGGVPGSESGSESQPAWETSEGGGGSPSEDSWEEGEAGGGGNPDEWETSNEVPGADPAAMPPMPSEQDQAGGGDGESAEAGGEGELNEALEVFDGEILAEREVIRTRANETSSGLPLPAPPVASTGSDDAPRSPGGPVSMPRNRNPGPVAGPSGPIPEDLPDAKDDDIIARQLREAAMQETDPILKEKIWDEYRRYKGA